MAVGGFLMMAPVATQQISAQSKTTSKNKDVTVEKSVMDATFRGEVLAESAINELEVAAWSRNIYRVISDSLEINGPLFTPVTSNKYQVNLFSLLIGLLQENKIKAYRFDVDNTAWGNAEEISLTEILQVNDIPYATTGSKVSVNPYDLPSNAVLNYYVKEQWYFDTKTGKGGVEIKAICPVLLNKDTDISPVGSAYIPVMKAPLFWVSFDEVSPYLVRASIDNSFSDLGQEYNYSMFDFFKKRYYKGGVYRIGNRILAEYYATPEDLAIEQAKIEKKLNEIELRFSKFQ